MKVIVLSDCHGQPHLVTNVLEHAKSWDRLIFSGDLLDIGLDPMGCLDVLLENNAELLWGNHDLAPLIGQRIHPASTYGKEIYSKLDSLFDSFKLSTYQDDILISHAGLSQVFYDNHFDTDLNTASEISDYLNDIPLRDHWSDQSILWYRPSEYYAPKVGLRQIAGHTPPGWIDKYGPKLINFVSIDPYCEVGFGPDRYRYAVIENQKVKILDSNME